MEVQWCRGKSKEFRVEMTTKILAILKTVREASNCNNNANDDEKIVYCDKGTQGGCYFIEDQRAHHVDENHPCSGQESPNESAHSPVQLNHTPSAACTRQKGILLPSCNAPENLCQDGWQALRVPTTLSIIKILPWCIDQNLVITVTRLQIFYSMFDAVAPLSLSLQQ